MRHTVLIAFSFSLLFFISFTLFLFFCLSLFLFLCFVFFFFFILYSYLNFLKISLFIFFTSFTFLCLLLLLFNFIIFSNTWLTLQLEDINIVAFGTIHYFYFNTCYQSKNQSLYINTTFSINYNFVLQYMVDSST